VLPTYRKAVVSIGRKCARRGVALSASRDRAAGGHCAARARASASGSGSELIVRSLRRHWIPPVALAAGQLAHGFSWLLLLGLAVRGASAAGLLALGWVHLVALGWLTMTALAILIHVIPGFTDAKWKAESVARGSLFVFEAGVIALVIAFCTGGSAALPWAGTLILAALTAYLGPAVVTLASALGGEKTETAIARALLMTLGALLVTGLIGTGLAWALAGYAPGSLLVTGPPAHAAFGLIGWLSVLVMGVSMRTIRPIGGARSRAPLAHVFAGGCEIAGVVLFAAGSLLRFGVLEWFGGFTIACGALVYVVDLADILRRATVAHRPPQAFLAMGIVWFVGGLALSAGAFSGAPTGASAVYVLLAGWIGQMVNGHLSHIGVRLIATVVRGDDDETRPAELLVPALSWTSFALFQCALAGGALALVLDHRFLLAAAAATGFVAWALMVANALLAARNARRLPRPPASPLTISLLRTDP
jgi:hypothetical protein